MKLLLMLFLCATAVSARAEPYEDATAAYDKGDYATALQLYRPLADKGDARAQNRLGVMYNIGQGVTEDYSTAMAWYRKAAEQGDADAQYGLGLMYMLGQGVPEDNASALMWYRKAAEQGRANAQFNLGSMYRHGDGVPKNFETAVIWYRKAAEQGLPNAQFELGVMYRDGKGVPQDYVQAHIWFNLAASRFSATRQEAAAKASISRDGVAVMMTPAQIGEAQNAARNWKRSSETPWWKFWLGGEVAGHVVLQGITNCSNASG
jgi:TPR repeat protein